MMKSSTLRAPDGPMTNVLGAPLCVVHIPKTAGATLRTFLIRAYGLPVLANAGNWLRHAAATHEKVARVGRKTKKSRALITLGHVPYALFRSELHERTRYMTLLRDPVDRVLSHYYRHLHGKNRGGAKLESLRHALDIGLPDITNLSTRLLCDDPSKQPSADSLEQAKRNLRNFLFVGLQERFDESVVLLHHALGLERLYPYGPSHHVNPGRPRAETISEAERQLIVAKNSLDVELYRYACDLFAERAATVSHLAADVERLRALCAPVLDKHAAACQRAADWLERQLPLGRTRLIEQLYAAAASEEVEHLPLVEEIGRMRGSGKAVIVVLDKEHHFISRDSRFLEMGFGSKFKVRPGSPDGIYLAKLASAESAPMQP